MTSRQDFCVSISEKSEKKECKGKSVVYDAIGV
jgi:hypothetical protein